jgi:hypothetical protein
MIIRNEQELTDLLADGKITDDDADAVRDFAEFLRHAGPPDGKLLVRLEHRPDLIRYVLGVDDATRQ